MKYKVFVSMFGRFPTLAIHSLNEHGEHSEKAVISFGLKKAEAILACIDQIKKFVESKGKES